MNKRRHPITHMIHETNHTQVSRVGSLATTHALDTNIVTDLGSTDLSEIYTKQNLNPGLYKITINEVPYVFDLYETVTGSASVVIEKINKAYINYHVSREPLILYEISHGSHGLSITYVIDNTVNDHFDMIAVDGFTKSSGTPSIASPVDITSITSLTFEHSGVLTGSSTYELALKTYIKALPNGVKDVCIINGELDKYHIITRVGRTVFSGYENWQMCDRYCKNGYHLYFCPDGNVKLENANNNLWCTHLPVMKCEDLMNTGTLGDYICTSNDSTYGQGFFMKVSDEYFDYTSNDPDLYYFQKWLNEIFLSGHAMVVEYPLASYNYKSLLIEDYNIPTYYNQTTLRLTSNSDCNVSYFYKSLS